MKKRMLIPVLLLVLFIQCKKNKEEEAPNIHLGCKTYFKLNGNLADNISDADVTGQSGTITFVEDRKGEPNRAALFEGAYFWFDFPETLYAAPMTISLWVKPKNLTTDGYFIKAKTAAFGVHQIDDRAGFVVSTPVTDGFATAFNNGWSHIVGSYDGKDVRLYINGEFKGSENNPGEPDATTRVEIGSLSDYPFSWEGALDDIRFYNRLLSEQEIKMLAEE